MMETPNRTPQLIILLLLLLLVMSGGLNLWQWFELLQQEQSSSLRQPAGLPIGETLNRDTKAISFKIDSSVGDFLDETAQSMQGMFQNQIITRHDVAHFIIKVAAARKPKAHVAEAVSLMNNLEAATQTYYTAHGRFPASPAELGLPENGQYTAKIISLPEQNGYRATLKSTEAGLNKGIADKSVDLYYDPVQQSWQCRSAPGDSGVPQEYLPKLCLSH